MLTDWTISPRGTKLKGVSLHHKLGPFIDKTNLGLMGSIDSAFTHVGGTTFCTSPRSSIEPSTRRLVMVSLMKGTNSLHMGAFAKYMGGGILELKALPQKEPWKGWKKSYKSSPCLNHCPTNCPCSEHSCKTFSQTSG